MISLLAESFDLLLVVATTAYVGKLLVQRNEWGAGRLGAGLSSIRFSQGEKRSLLNQHVRRRCSLA